jgi:hypothetical protein
VIGAVSEVDLKSIVDDAQKERVKWRKEANQRLALLIEKSKSKVMSVMSDLQHQIEKL